MTYPLRTSEIVLRVFAIWTLIIPLAFLNGLLRETLLLRILSPGTALAASGILLSLLILRLAWLSVPYFGALRKRSYLYIGASWLAFSILFESGFGLTTGKTLDELLLAYDMRSGNLWVVVLASIATSPWITAKLRKHSRGGLPTS